MTDGIGIYGGGARVIHSGDGSGSIVGTGALIGGICILGAAIYVSASFL